MGARWDPGASAAPAVSVQVQARVFTVLWAVATVAHLLRKGNPSDQLAWVVLIAAILVAQKPTSWLRLAALSSTQVIYLVTKLPFTDNHLVIMGFVSLGLLISAVRFAATSNASTSHPAAEALPYVRLTIVIAYGAAAIAKLNQGFFEHDTSCAITMTRDALAVFNDRAPELSSWVQAALPFIVAGAELAIPVLLLVARARLLGVAAVVVFHLLMSLSPTATAGDFTIVLFALVLLFLPAAAAQAIAAWSARAAGAVPDAIRLIAMVLLSLALVAMLGGHRIGFTTVAGNPNWIVLATGSVGLGALLLAATWRSWREDWNRTVSLVPPRVSYVVLLVLLVANASAPYLGSKTASTFTMYSNLQTEDQRTNHFFVPRLPLAGSQDDLVRVEASSNPGLQHIGELDLQLTWHELQRRLSHDPEASIRFERGGELFEYEHARENPDLVSRHPVWHRLIGHRAYDPDVALCRW